jgi:tetraacyldisaccharide 4'-kinase
VGNLALGGTGKTPVVINLAGGLASLGYRGAVLTRGFGSRLAGPLNVGPDNSLAGDEARLMAASLASCEWPVIQAKRRDQGMEHIASNFPQLDVVIVEDGHQTARLGRDLDIVILDAWVVVREGDRNFLKPVTGPVFPFGPWRESALGAERAGIWVLETDDQRHLTLRWPDGKEAADLEGKSPAVLSGIARPEAFESTLEKILPDNPVLAVRLGDHAQYAPRLVNKIAVACAAADSDYLITTAKDWVKLKPFWQSSLPVFVADLAIRWGQNKALPAMIGERLELSSGNGSDLNHP